MPRPPKKMLNAEARHPRRCPCLGPMLTQETPTGTLRDDRKRCQGPQWQGISLSVTNEYRCMFLLDEKATRHEKLYGASLIH